MDAATSAGTSDRPLVWAHPVSFKLNDEQIQRAASLRATFESNTWAKAFRWLLDDPVVKQRIAERVRGEI